MQLTPWTSADTANQAQKATSPTSGSWRTTWRTSLHSIKLGSAFHTRRVLLGRRICASLRGQSPSETILNYLLLSPWLNQDAATLRPGNGGWATVGVPRIIAIAVLNGFRVHAFDDLPVVRFAVAEVIRVCSPRNIPSPSRKTSGLSAITKQTFERLGATFGARRSKR